MHEPSDVQNTGTLPGVGQDAVPVVDEARAARPAVLARRGACRAR